MLDAATAALLATVAPGANGVVGINLLDPNTETLSPLASHSVPNVDRIKEATTSTFEVGYQGLINNKVLVAADVWYSEKADFVSPLVVTTPLLLLDGPSMVAYMVPLITEELVGQSGGLLDVATAQAMATGLAGQLADGGDGPGGTPGLAELPLGVVSGPEVDPSGSNLLLTYVNAGDIGLWGADFSIKAFLTDEWVLAATGSWVSDDYFDLAEIENGIAPIALNAPDLKGHALARVSERPQGPQPGDAPPGQLGLPGRIGRIRRHQMRDRPQGAAVRGGLRGPVRSGRRHGRLQGPEDSRHASGDRVQPLRRALPELRWRAGNRTLPHGAGQVRPVLACTRIGPESGRRAAREQPRVGIGAACPGPTRPVGRDGREQVRGYRWPTSTRIRAGPRARPTRLRRAA